MLIEEGDYDVDLVPDGISALASAQENPFALTILDCEADDIPFAELTTTLKDWQPTMQLVIVPPNNDPDDPAINHTDPDALLSKPFYLPDLLHVVSNLLTGRSAEEVDEEEPIRAAAEPDAQAEILEEDAFPWLEDANRAAQYLTSLTLETDARAALIMRGEKVWAYAGELGQPAANELAETLGRQWGSQSGNDLARFVTVEGTEYMLYATGLSEGMVLALIFNAKTPFSKVRTESSQLAKALAISEDRSETSPSPPPIKDKADLTEEENRNGNSPSTAAVLEVPQIQDETDQQVPEPLTIVEAAEPAGLPLDWLPQNLSNDGELLEEVEQSLEPFAIPSDWAPQNSASSGRRSYLEELLGEPIPSVSFPYESRVKPDSTFPGSPSVDEQPYYPSPESMAETRPTRVPPEEPVPQLEPETASYFDITYACMLMPRIPQHHLVSDLAKQLEKWMFQICVSFDWRLEQLAIRPDYMQWMVKVHSATAPRFLMQIITRITSQRIFEHYAHLEEENPSGEFWAPGWLVITSETLPSQQMVQEFVAKTRQRQGLG